MKAILLLFFLSTSSIFTLLGNGHVLDQLPKSRISLKIEAMFSLARTVDKSTI